MKQIKLIIAALLFISPLAANADAIMYASSNDGNIYTVDTTNASAVLIGNTGANCCTEIEYDNVSGAAWAQNRNGAFSAHAFDINTGAAIGPDISNGGAFNGLEFVGGILYGTYILASGGPSTLATLDPATGAVVNIGLTGTGPMSGLAYDLVNSIMYGISGGGPGGSLWTLDLTTGWATTIGNIGFVAGSLQFDGAGNLIGGGGQTNAGDLYLIDPLTAASTLIGNTGIGTVTGLTLVGEVAVPEPGTLALLGLGLAGMGMTRRKKKA